MDGGSGQAGGFAQLPVAQAVFAPQRADALLEVLGSAFRLTQRSAR